MTKAKQAAMMGTVVSLIREGRQEPETYCLCDRTDLGKHKKQLNCRTSDLAIGILGKKPGDKVTLDLPGGRVRVEILSVELDDEQQAA